VSAPAPARPAASRPAASTGNTDDACYWERTKDAEHRLESITANNNVTGTAVVTISAKDVYFKTAGCQDWKKTG